VSERRIVGRSLSHLPPFPPSRTYSRADPKDLNESSTTKKRKLENGSEDNSAASSQLREKKIIATKNIQKTLTRLDSMLTTPDNGHQETARNAPTSSREETAPNPNASSQAPLYCGPSLSSLTSSSDANSSAHVKGGGHMNSHQIVLDENCDLLKGLSKEERLLMGLPVTGQGQAAGGGPGGGGGESNHHEDER
jgi:hypothetical protein